MAKISLLPVANDLDGSELVPVVRAGKTHRASVGPLVGAAAQPFIDRAESAADAAEAFVGPTFTSVQAGLAGTVDDQVFAVAVGGIVTIYLNAGGDAIYQRDALTKALLADASRATDLINHKRRGMTAAEVRTLADKVDDRFDFRDMLGAQINGNNDMASLVSAASTLSRDSGAPCHFPGNAVIALGSPVSIQPASSFIGMGSAAYTNYADADHRDKGTWFHIAHGDVGFKVGDGNLYSGIKLWGFGTFRDQPDPAPGWEPYNHAYDFVINNADAELYDIMMLNPTRGIDIPLGQGGKCRFRDVRGQPFFIGMNIDGTLDTVHITGTHWWPFWSNDPYTRAYCLANRYGLSLLRADNVIAQDHFDIFSKIGLVIQPGETGTASRLLMSNFGFDNMGQAGMLVGIGADGATAQFSNGYVYGDPSSELSTGFTGLANNTTIMLDNFRVSETYAQAVLQEGVGNTLQIGNLHADNWNRGNIGATVVGVAVGNRAFLANKIAASGGNGGGIVNNPAFVSSEEEFSVTPTPSAQSGTIASATSRMTYQRKGDLVSFDLTINIFDNGTGAGTVNIALPLPVRAGRTETATGRETVTSGKTLSASLVGSLISIQTYDNLYPAANGSVINISGQYRTTAI